ncbi:MAG TPA: IPT/TIG domain-containing protein [Longimicrobium sp.]|nr:IPT/TIG domain-containing protein [Longimicrobium sp.]
MDVRRPGRRSARRPASFLRLPWTALVLALAAACGEGTGPGTTPDPDNPVPSISSVDPATLLQWSDSATVTVTGAGFVNGAVVRLNGSSRLTTYHSPSQLTAVVPAASLQQSGTLQLTVFNPAPGGGESGGTALPVHHRAPAVTDMSPGGVLQGDAAFTLTVTGSGFAQASVVRWNGADRPTTFVSQGQLTAQIPAGDVAAVGTPAVAVFNPAPGGGLSPARTFIVGVRPNPVPVAAAISPSAIMAETGTTFTVTGSGFMAGTRVFVGGYAPVVTVNSPNQLQFTLAPENVPNAGFAQVFVSNPPPGGGGSTPPLSLRVDNPVPTLSALSPATAVSGADSQAVRLTGTGFVRASMVEVNGMVRTSRRISPTELELVLGRTDLLQPATYSIVVRNANPGGGATSMLHFNVQTPVPVAQSLTPSQALAGQDSLVVRVTGSGFYANTVVRVGAAARPTRRISATELEAVLPAEDLFQPGTKSITVFTPAPGGGTSAVLPLELTAPVPVMGGLSSNGASAGRPGFALTVHGSGFLSSSVVQWNGTTRTTRFISNTRLETTLTSADVASARTASVAVHTPGAGTSAAAQLTMRVPGPATVTSLLTLDLPAADVAWDPTRSRIYASITAGEHANTVVRIDPATGAVEASVGVGSSPGKLAVSSDGSTLWVGLNGANQVRRVALGPFTLGSAFSTSVEPTELHAMPGQPGTVAVVRGGLVTVYDDGVARAGDGGSNTIAFGETSGVLYGYNNYSSEFGLRTFRVDAAGVTETKVQENLLGGYYTRILFSAGRVYGSNGTVVDPGQGVRAGRFEAGINPSSFAVDTRLGRAFFMDSDGGELSVFDVNTFQPLGSVFVSSMYNEHPAHARERLLQWGTDGLVMNDGERLYIFRTPLAGP